VQYAFLPYGNLGLAQHFRNVFKFNVFYHPVYDDNRVVESAALDKVILIKHFKLMEKAERATRCDFFFKLPDIRDGGMLATQHRRVVVDHDGHPGIVQGSRSNLHVSRGLPVRQLLLYFEEVADCVLLFSASVLEYVDKG